jgi:small subunit ribosomal protein S8
MVVDVLSDILTRIRNSLRLKINMVEVRKTITIYRLCQILLQESLVEEIIESTIITKGKPYKSRLRLRLKYIGAGRTAVISNLRRVSRSSLRVYRSCLDVPFILDGFGLSVISTSYGLMVDRDSRRSGLGGEIILSIWLRFIYYMKLCVFVLLLDGFVLNAVLFVGIEKFL